MMMMISIIMSKFLPLTKWQNYLWLLLENNSSEVDIPDLLTAETSSTLLILKST
jgi:hypothetical protein